MKINVALNRKSIQDAIDTLKKIKKVVPQMQTEFISELAKWIVNRANYYIDIADLGINVKNEIKTAWVISNTPHGISITNSSQPAVFVEFGVGVVGSEQPHPMASTQSYEYNKESGKKDNYGYWHFFSNEADLDIPKSAISWGENGKGEENRMSIYTRGTEGVWYAYNAIVDAKVELQKSNGEIANIWKKIKERYIG